MLKSNDAVRHTTEKYNLPSMQEYIELCNVAARNTLSEYLLLVNRVVELSFKRDLNKALNEFQKDCFSGLSLNELNTKVYDKLDRLTEKYITSEAVKMFSDIEDDLWNEICSRRTEEGVYGIPSKIAAVNDYFTYEPTELVLLKARMKKGKSAFMMNEAIHKIKQGIPTLYIDTEMSDRLFYERMLANLTGIEVTRIKNGRYTEDEAERIAKARTWIRNQPFVHIYDPQMTDDTEYAICKVLKYKMGLKFVVHDYIKSNAADSSVQYNELGAKCDFLKNKVAGDLELSVLTGAQLNRQN